MRGLEKKDPNGVTLELFEKLKKVVSNCINIIDEEPYESEPGFLESTPKQIEDFKVTIASAIAPEFS